jgi:hypothetical protein
MNFAPRRTGAVVCGHMLVGRPLAVLEVSVLQRGCGLCYAWRLRKRGTPIVVRLNNHAAPAVLMKPFPPTIEPMINSFHRAYPRSR